MFATRIPRNSASRQDPNVIVKTPKKNRIPLGIVNELARTMLTEDRLVRGRGSRPRAFKRSPVSAASLTMRATALPCVRLRCTASARRVTGLSKRARSPALPGSDLSGVRRLT